MTLHGPVWLLGNDPAMGGVGGPVGPPSWFVALFFLVLVGGAAVTVWRVVLAREVARESGMDPDKATAMTLLSDDGLDAAYLAANLRGSVPTPGTSAERTRPVEERLRDLQRLRDEGLVTPEEYDERRRSILDSL